MGTPLYMAPEQCRGAQQVDWRADIYSLGCIMFEMACGRPPFLGEGFGEIIAQQIREPPPAPTSIEPTVAPQIEEVILRALAKKPEERQQSMAEIATSLDGLFSGRYATGRMPTMPEMAAQAAGPGTMRRTAPPAPHTTLGGAAAELAEDPTPARRGRGAAVAITLAVLLVAGGVGFVAIKSKKGDASPPAPVPAPVAAPAPQGQITPPPPAVVPAAAPEKIKLKIASEPAGAEVFRLADGVLVGMTPMTVDMEKTQGMAAFVVKAAGFEDAKVQLPADHDGETSIELQRAKAAAHHGSHTGPATGGGAATETKTSSGPKKGRSVLIDPFEEKPRKK